MRRLTSPPWRSFRRRAAAGLIAVLTTIALGVPATLSAQGADYPTWSQLQQAKRNTAAAKAAVAKIQSLIAGLQTAVDQANALAEQKNLEYLDAQQKYDDAARVADTLDQQARDQKAVADTSAKAASVVAAQLYRTGGSSLTLNLFLENDPAKADQLLNRLGTMNQVVGSAAASYARALTAAQTAKSLTDQAAVARDARDQLRAAAETALAAAQEAQATAHAALKTQQDKQVELQAQVRFLQDREAATAAAYQAGVEAERKRQEELARQNSGQLPPGFVNPNGWARPAAGSLSDGYGPRAVICSDGGCSGPFHYGQDISTGCRAPIYAANAGRVVFAGYAGTWGNYVKIDHGGGLYTAYAHIRSGGIFVAVGDLVNAGQNIGSSGSTGASTGCHLHFEVYQNSVRINPRTFMAARGIAL